jgi:hypothetical protein
LLFGVVELFLIAVAVLRRLPFNLRVGGLWLVGYIAAILNLSRTGLSGAGPLYLLVIPILMLILVGKRASFLTAIFSGLLVVGSAILVELGLLSPSLSAIRQGAGLTTIIMFLTVVMTILILFYGLQERLIADERRAQADLRKAQALLEEQNVNLEQEVEKRTRELQLSNLSLEQRINELAILNNISAEMGKTLDVQVLTRIIGDKLLAIFETDSALIMLLDKNTNLIHVLYEYDKNEGGYIDFVEPFPLGTGVSSKVILTGQPLLLNTLEEEIANGAYFPAEIIEKGSGFYSQSWIGVPIRAGEQVLGLIALSDARAYAFNENQLKFLETLSVNMGVTIENARLFQAEQKRVTELEIINSIQQGVAAERDFQAIVDLIGDKLREIFNTPDLKIGWFDAAANLIHDHYVYEHGHRI